MVTFPISLEYRQSETVRQKGPVSTLSIKGLVIYVRNFLDSDWRRVVEFRGNAVQEKGN